MEEGESIEAQVQRELDALSLDDLTSDDENCDISSQSNDDDDKLEIHGTDDRSTLLFLAKSSARNKHSHKIIEEADEMLIKLTTIKDPIKLSENPAEHDSDVDFRIFPLLDDRKALISAKTIDEIEEDNRTKEEELEQNLKIDEEKAIIEIKQAKDIEEEDLKRWESKEEKMTKSVKIMLDKADYWEKTYEEVAHDEFALKQKELEEEFHRSQKKILEMENKERKFLEDLLHEQQKLESQKREDAAIKIQRNFRGYVVRKDYGAEVKTRMKEARNIVTAKKIAAIEEQRSKNKARIDAATEQRNQLAESNKSKTADKVPVTTNSDLPNNNGSFIILSEEESKDKSILTDMNSQRQKQDVIPSNQVKDEMKHKTTNSIETKTETITESLHSNGDPFKSTDAQGNRSIHDSDDDSDSNTSLSDRNIDIGEKNVTICSETEKKSETSTDSDNLTQKNTGDGFESEKPVETTDPTLCNIVGLTTSSQKTSATPSNIEEMELNTTLHLESNSSLNLAEEAINITDRHESSTENHSATVKNDSTQNIRVGSSPTSNDSSTLTDKMPPSEEKITLNQNVTNIDTPIVEDIEIEDIGSPLRHVVETKLSYNSAIGKKSMDATEISKMCADETTYTSDETLLDTQLNIYQNLPNTAASDQRLINVQSVDAEIISNNHSRAHQCFIEKPGQLQGHDTSPSVIVSNITMNSAENLCSDAQNPSVTSKAIYEDGTDMTLDQNEVVSTQKDVDSHFETVYIANPNRVRSTSPNSGNEDSKNVTNADSMRKYSAEVDILKSMEINEPPAQITKTDISKPTDEIASNLYAQKEKALDATPGLEVTAKENNIADYEISYELQVEKQHRAWSERIHEFDGSKEKRKSSEARIGRRKINRASSAAKRLSSFLKSEILEGSFYLPDCDISSKTTSEEEIRCIVLMNISGGRNLSGFSTYIGLTHLLVQNCGILSLEGLHSCHNLKYISAPHNAINLISCSGMKHVEYIDLSHNQLTSIHGLDQCGNLLFLDLSHNSISKITGLEDTTNLAHVRLAENQLLSVNGLSCCQNLMYLDVSDNHLTNLDSLSDNKHLISVDASGNYVEYLEEKILDSFVLLIKLNVSRNSLPSLGMTSKTWLPSLIDIQATNNRIGCDPSQLLQNFAISCPFLCDLNMRQNLLPDLDSLKSLRNCQCLNHVDITDNPILTSGTDDQRFLKSMPEILTVKSNSSHPPISNENNPFGKYCVLESLVNTSTNLTQDDSTYNSQNILDVVSMFLRKVQIEEKRHLREVRKAFLRCSSNHEVFQEKNSIPPTVFTLHSNHLKKMLQISSGFRRQFDTFGLDENVTISSPIDSNPRKEMLNPSGCPNTNRPNSNENITDTSHETEISDTSIGHSSLQSKLKELILSPSLPSSNQISKNLSVYKKLRRVESSTSENLAAKKLQACWRGYRVRKRHALVKAARQSAAVMIQALWRGYNTRRKIQQAMKILKEHEKADVMYDDELEDVDLEGFNFDEESFEEQWAYRVTGKPSQSDESIKNVPQNSPLSDHQLEYRRPVDVETMSFASSKPPLPPISPARYSSNDTRSALTPSISETTGNYAIESSQSRNSHKQDMLTTEWGIKSSSTADLMMKRARRMKGAKKKTRTAEEKLQKFQEKVSAYQGAEVLTARRPPPNKIDYFRAREEAFHQKEYTPNAEDEQKMNYTYEWLHKQVGSHYNESTKPYKKKPNSSDSYHTRSGLFPTIPRSPSLVGAQDLEVVSLNSGSNFSERSKDRLKDIARRHNPYLSNNKK